MIPSPSPTGTQGWRDIASAFSRNAPFLLNRWLHARLMVSEGHGSLWSWRYWILGIGGRQ